MYVWSGITPRLFIESFTSAYDGFASGCCFCSCTIFLPTRLRRLSSAAEAFSGDMLPISMVWRKSEMVKWGVAPVRYDQMFHTKSGKMATEKSARNRRKSNPAWSFSVAATQTSWSDGA